MGANLQFVFYYSARKPEILFMVFLNQDWVSNLRKH